ncbi:MAG TPA: exo-alpha-sialidase [Candidatus Marinimicrobia bacterium]|nr:exo-alpha-sialidase [Candidatus Neomarinimicrobiota bacterium]HIO36784.1 exo-alpha-sialidase [Candidatus Neomarinimicrobiota bacterium]
MLIFAGCESPPMEVRSLESPAPLGSRFPNLTTTSEGTMIMSWFTPYNDQGGYELKMAEWDGTLWSEPNTIYKGDDFFVNWADVPSIFQVNGDRLAAHWLYMRGGGTYEYDVYLSTSYDRGLTWSEPMIPHRDGVAAEHGFVSFFHRESGGLGIAWLDGRNMISSDDGHGSGAMSIFTTNLDQENRLDQEFSLDARVCECCPTAAATIGASNIIAYRDRGEEEIRNIQVVRYSGGVWSKPSTVHEDGWMIPGCPVNGPALAVSGDRLAIAWYTAPKGDAQVKVAFSKDVGASFSEPVRIDGGIPLGRVDLEWVDHSSVIVSWIEVAGDSAELKLRKVSLKGEVDSPLVVSNINAARGSGYPQMVNYKNELVFAWTEPGQWEIRMARLNKNSL